MISIQIPRDLENPMAFTLTSANPGRLAHTEGTHARGRHPAAHPNRATGGPPAADRDADDRDRRPAGRTGHRGRRMWIRQHTHHLLINDRQHLVGRRPNIGLVDGGLGLESAKADASTTPSYPTGKEQVCQAVTN
jgi:hypothetical protein